MLNSLFKRGMKFRNEFLWIFVLCASSATYGLWIFRESFSTLFSNSIPLGGDGASTGFFLRLVLESSWQDFFSQHIYSEQFGWPGKIDYTSYPTGQFLELTIIKLAGMLFGLTDPAGIIHFSAVLKIVPISLSAYILLRVLSIPRLIAFLGAIAFSTSTYNLIRAEGHFFLGMTWSVPLAMAALFLSYKFSYLQENYSKRMKQTHLLQIAVLSLPIGFSNFYYSLVSIILNGLFLGGFWIARSTTIEIKRKSFGVLHNLKSEVIKSTGFIISGISITIGLVFQLLPILYRSSKNPALSGIADRSATESIVFSGSLESYFFDFSSAVLKLLDRREILNFTSTRISWEGSQVGALAGFVGFIFLVLVCIILMISLWNKDIIKEQSFFNSFIKDRRVGFIVLLMSVLLFLYLPNPVNFGISQILPQLRAWGRVSVFLTMSSIALICIVVSRVKRDSVVGGLLIVILTSLPFLEAYEFRMNRPAATDISRVALEVKNQRSLTLDALKSFLPLNCQIFQVPIYPYPEFDRPDDAVGDYASIMLPGEDPGYFKWSSPAIKNSHEWKSIQPLVSENPNFARVSPTYTIEYAAALGACAVLVDRAMLTEPEINEFVVRKVKSQCKVDLPGERFDNEARFQVIKISGEFCSFPLSKVITEFASSNNSGKFIWKIDQAYGVKFVSDVQIFPVSSAINSRVTQGLKYTQGNRYSWIISFYDENMNQVSGSQFNVCKLYVNKLDRDCFTYSVNQKDQIEIFANEQELSKELMKFEFTLENIEKSPNKISYWGIKLLQK